MSRRRGRPHNTIPRRRLYDMEGRTEAEATANAPNEPSRTAPTPPCDNCPICSDPLHDSPTHVLECGHEFHTACAVSWFRSSYSHGTCPICRDGDNSNEQQEESDEEYEQYQHNYRVYMQRSARLRRMARRRDAPRRLRTLVRHIQQAEARLSDRRREMREFRSSERWKAPRSEFLRLQRLGASARQSVMLRRRRLVAYGVAEGLG